MSRKVSFKSLGLGALMTRSTGAKAPEGTGNFRVDDDPPPRSPASPAGGGGGRRSSQEKYQRKTDQRVDKLKLPRVVLKCIEVLDEHGTNTNDLMMTEYATGPRGRTVRELQRHAEENDFDEFDKCTDMHAVAGVMMQYFEGMHEPIAGYEAYGAMMECAKRSPEETSLKLSLREVTHRLPKENFFLMKYVAEFLHRVVKAPTNVTSEKLAEVFGPIFLRNYDSLFPKEDKVTSATGHAVRVVDTVINDPESLFQCDEWEALWNDCTYWREKAKSLAKKLAFIQPDYDKMVVKEKEWRDRIAALEKENRELKDRIAQLEKDAVEDRSALKKAVERAETAEGEVERLKEEIARLKQDNKAKDGTIADQAAEIARLKDEIARLEAQVKDLQNQMKALMAENGKQAETLKEREKRIKDLLKEIEELRAALGDKNKNVVVSSKELEGLKARIRDLERSNMDLADEVRRLKLELDELRKLLEEKDALIARLRRELADAMDGHEKYKGQYDELMARFQELMAEVERLRAHLAAKEAMIQKLQIELKKKALEIVRWRTESEKWKTEVEMPTPDIIASYHEKVKDRKDGRAGDRSSVGSNRA